jgi:hypothetical protein
MKKHYSPFFTLFLYLLLSSFTIQSQELEFTDALCGTFRDFRGSCPTEDIVEIDVTGVGVLGIGNYGLAGVFFDISQDFGFFSRITLEAPNGNTYVLASGEEGINSFPGYVAGTTLGVLLTHCGDLPSTSDEVGNPDGLSFQPIDDFSALNTIGLNANGTWKFRFCGLPDGIFVLCCGLTFDNSAPTMTCPSNLVLPVDAGECSAAFFLTDPIPSDNCEIASFTAEWTTPTGTLVGPFPGSPGNTFNYLFDGGTSIFTFTATDDLGFSTSCTTEVVVEDLEPPTFLDCPSDIIVMSSTQPGECSGSVSIIDPTPEDNCEIGSFDIIYSYADGSMAGPFPGAPGQSFDLSFQVGINTASYLVTDNGGNTFECIQTITVEDDEAPVWDDGNLSVTVTAECGIDDIEQIMAANVPTASDNCGSVTVTEVDLFMALGCGSTTVYDVIYEATDDAGNTTTDMFSVTINYDDTTPPVLSGIGEDVAILCSDPFPEIPAPTAADACDGDLTGFVSMTSSIESGPCIFGEVVEIQTFVYTVSDACGNSASESWVVTITTDLVLDLGADQLICDSGTSILDAGIENATYAWSTGATTQTIDINTAGTYSVTVTTAGGCCAEDEITVTIASPPNVSATGGTIGCGGDAITIMGNSTTIDASFSWTGPGGFISSDQNPMVSQVGTYELIVTSFNGCTASTTVEVMSDMNAPTADATGGSISCTQGSIQLMGSSPTAGVTYNWTGPGGFTSTDQNPTVSNAGEYILTVTAMNGCVAMATAQVISDTQAPGITLSANPLTCQQTSTQITTMSTDPAATFSWSGPNSFSSTDQNPTVSAAGAYTVTATGVNGCFTTQMITISQDADVPNATAVGATLNCSANAVQLMGSSTTPGVTYSWAGPNGFSSTLQNPMVSTAGSYTLTVTAPNGCTAMSTATVTTDANVPDVIVAGGTINCISTSIQLQGSSTTTGVSYSWTGPNGFTSTDQNPMVSAAGIYQLTVTAQNGCSAQASTIVDMNTTAPDANAFLGSVNCQTSSVALNALSLTTGVSYSWTGPNGFTSNDQNTTISETGTYNLVVTAPNGCTSTASVVLNETITPIEGNVTSSMDGNASITVSGGKPPYTYSWDNGATTSSTTGLTVGSHFVIVTDVNGCQKIFPFQVEMSTGTIDPELIEYWKVYPTVTKGAFSIDAQFNIPIEGTIEIFTSAGKILEREELKGSFNIQKGYDISFMPGGIYFLALRTEHGHMVTKMILAK